MYNYKNILYLVSAIAAAEKVIGTNQIHLLKFDRK